MVFKGKLGESKKSYITLHNEFVDLFHVLISLYAALR